MESAALTKAHEHVRSAATATFDSRVAVAGQEHDLAAAAFHDAEQDTTNAEVPRIYCDIRSSAKNRFRHSVFLISSKATTTNSRDASRKLRAKRSWVALPVKPQRVVLVVRLAPW